MDRRKFLVSSGIVGAGMLGGGAAAPGVFEAAARSESESYRKMEDKPVAITVPPLPYPFDALEPYIDAKTMEIHHDKHHKAYVDNLNKAIEGTELGNQPVESLIANLASVPEKIRATVQNNGGGHANHSLFWTIMGKGKGGKPSGALA